ncbi:hypothetical protein ACFE04_002239 [Oxalis oulophora]
MGDQMLHINFETKLSVSETTDKLLDERGKDKLSSQSKDPNKKISVKDLGKSEQESAIALFDICLSKRATVVSLKPYLLDMNREKRNKKLAIMEGENRKTSRPGNDPTKEFFIHQRSGFSLTILIFIRCDNVTIVKMCQEIGRGRGVELVDDYKDVEELMSLPPEKILLRWMNFQLKKISIQENSLKLLH